MGRKIKISRDVIFDEHSDHLSLPLQETDTSIDYEPITAPSKETESSSDLPRTLFTTRQVEGELPEVIQPEPQNDDADSTNSNHTTSETIVRHSPYPLRNRLPYRQWESLICTTEPEEPKSFDEAMNSAEVDRRPLSKMNTIHLCLTGRGHFHSYLLAVAQ